MLSWLFIGGRQTLGEGWEDRNVENISCSGFGPWWCPLGTLGFFLMGASINPARTDMRRRVHLQKGSSLSSMCVTCLGGNVDLNTQGKKWRD